MLNGFREFGGVLACAARHEYLGQMRRRGLSVSLKLDAYRPRKAVTGR